MPDFVYDSVRRYMDDRCLRGGDSAWRYEDGTAATPEMMRRAKAALSALQHGKIRRRGKPVPGDADFPTPLPQRLTDSDGVADIADGDLHQRIVVVGGELPPRRHGQAGRGLDVLKEVNGNPVKLLDTKADISRSAPDLGQDNAAIYGELLGLTEADLTALKEQQVI